MHPILIVAVMAIAFFALKAKSGSAIAGELGVVHANNSWGLPDIDPANQGGGFSTDFDDSFEKAQGATGVPFALMKAHAVRESALNPDARGPENNNGTVDYGLMQLSWVQGRDRFKKYGYPDDSLQGGSVLLDPDTNCLIAGYLIRDNLNWLKGDLRDTINAYNTGTPESGTVAPKNYVNDVLNNYSKIVGREVS